MPACSIQADMSRFDRFDSPLGSIGTRCSWFPFRRADCLSELSTLALAGVPWSSLGPAGASQGPRHRADT
eukprot:14225305-Alexandrium_andersonii.AAC.1